MTTSSTPAPPRSRPLSPRTQQMQQTQAMGIVGMLLILGPPAVIAGAILLGLSRLLHAKWSTLVLAFGSLIALGMLYWRHQAMLAEVLALWATLKPLLPKNGGSITWPHIQTIGLKILPVVGSLWLQFTICAPLVASFLNGARVKTAEELEREREHRIEQQRVAAVTKAGVLATKAPDIAKQTMVFGSAIDGDLNWTVGQWATYPPSVLGRHLVLIGGSGTGKTETVIRLGYGARRAYNWRIYYLDCKGDDEIAERFLTVMGQAGCNARAFFPTQPYDGWRGNPTALLNRLLTIVDYTEPFYRDVAKMALDLAVHAPPHPPRSSRELLERLDLETLASMYKDQPQIRELGAIEKLHMNGAYTRYRAFFQALHGGLDGQWAFEDVQAGYIMLKGLELKDQTASIGRFLMEDFAHFVSARKDPNDRVLLIVDEFPAIAFGGANAATLFEMVRSRGAGVVITAQSYAGMGDGADRILGAAASLLLHQCGDPDELLKRAGMETTYQRRISFAQRGVSTTNPREYELGEGSLAASRELKIRPDHVKTLQPGECFLISGGRYQHLRVSQVRGAAVQERRESHKPETMPSATNEADQDNDSALASQRVREVRRPERRPMASYIPPEDPTMVIGGTSADTEVSEPTTPTAPDDAPEL